MANFTNKFILKADTKDLNSQLLQLNSRYDKVMESIAESTRKTSVAEDNLTKAIKRRTLAVANVGKTKAFQDSKKEIEVLKELVAVEKRRSVGLKAQKKFIEESTLATKNRLASLEQMTASQRKSTTVTKTATKANKAYNRSLNDGSNGLVKHIQQLQNLAISFFALKSAYDVTLGRGHEFNVLIEQETIGLKLLIAQNVNNIDVLGQSITAQEKFILVQNEATRAIKIAREINVETPHTLGETLQILKLITPQVLKYGGSLNDVGIITKNVSITASAMGIEFQQLLKTVDSLMSGAMAESGLKRSLEQFGITQNEVNKLIKQGGDVTQLFIDKLSQADPAGKALTKTWQGVSAQFINVYDELAGEIQKPLFEFMKQEILGVTAVLKENQKTILTVTSGMGSAISVGTDLIAIYAGLKLATILGTKALKTNTGATLLASIAGREHSAIMSAQRLSALRLATSLKSLALANPILAISTGAFIAYELAMSGAREESEKLAKATKLTRLEIGLLGEETFKQSEASIKKSITTLENSLKKLNQLGKDSQTSRGRNISGSAIAFNEADISLYDRILLSEKELNSLVKLRIESTQKELAERRKSLATYNEIPISVRAILQAEKQLQESIQANNNKVKAQNTLLTLTKDTEVEKKKKINETIISINKQTKSQKEGLDEAQKLLTALGFIRAGFGGAKGEAEGLKDQLKESAKQALLLSQEIVKGDLLRGNITNKNALLEIHKIRIENIEAEENASKKATLLKKEENTFLKEIQTLEQRIATEQKQQNNDLIQAKIRLANAQKDTNKSLALQISLIENNGATKEIQQLQIKALRQETLNSKVKIAIKNTKDLAKQQKLLRREANAELKILEAKNKIASLLSQKEAGINGLSKDEQRNINISQLEKEIIAQEKISKIAKDNVSLAKEDIDKQRFKLESLNQQVSLLEKQNELIKLQETSWDKIISQLKDELPNLLGNLGLDLARSGGDVNSAVQGLFKGGVSALQSSPDPLFKSIGFGVDILTTAFNGSLSDAELKIAEGRVNFTDDSILKISEAVNNVNNPLLPFTKDTAKNTADMSKGILALSKISLDASGLEFQGNNLPRNKFQANKTTSLIDEGIKIDSIKPGQRVEADIISKIREVKTAFFDVFTISDKIKTISNTASDDFNDELTNIFDTGFGQVERSAELLNISTDKLKSFEGSLDLTSLKELDESEMEERFTNAISEIFSQSVKGLDNIDSLLSRYAKSGEDAFAEIERISLQYEQFNEQFFNLGFSGAGNVQSVLDTVNAFNSDNLQQNLDTFNDRFLTDQEKFKNNFVELSDSFLHLNVVMPNTREEFKTLIEEFNVFDENSAETFNSLLGLSDGVDIFMDSIDTANDKIRKDAETLQDELASLLEKSLSIVEGEISTLRGTLSQSIRAEIDKDRKALEDGQKTISELISERDSFDKQSPLTSKSIFDLIAESDIENNKEIESNIKKWQNQEIDAFSDASKIRIDSINEEIDIANSLADTITKLKDDVDNSFKNIFGNKSVGVLKSSFQSAVDNKDFDNIGSSFNDFAKSVFSQGGRTTENVLEVARARQQVSDLESPIKRNKLEEDTTATALNTASINLKTQEMFNALIEVNKVSLPNVEDTITALKDEYIELFDTESDIYKYLERGATDRTLEDIKSSLISNLSQQDTINNDIKKNQLDTQLTMTDLVKEMAKIQLSIDSLKEKQVEGNEIAENGVSEQKKVVQNTTKSIIEGATI